MKILLADPDRDLLMCYKRLLELDNFEVTAVFDGTQAFNLIKQTSFDLAVINRDIPRVGSRELVKLLNAANTPSIILLGTRITPPILLDHVAASSYLSFPFFPYELRQRISDILKKKESDRLFVIEDIEIEPSKFRSTDGTCFTNEEIDILTELQQGGAFEAHKRRMYISAINNKFERLKKKSRIKYVINKGYRLVKENE